MSQNYTEAITNSSTHPRSVFYCPQALGVSWELNSVTFTWILATIILIASPITIILNALIIIAVKQRKELQKHSNIMLSSMAVADFLVGAITLPLGATVDLLIFYQVSPEHVCTLSIANKDLMACFLLSSLHHLTGIAWERYVAVRKWKDYRVIVTRSRIKKLAVFAWLSAILSTVPSPIMQAIGVDLDVLKFRIVSGNVCGAVALTVLVYFYLMVYLGVRKRQTSEIGQVAAQLQAKHEFKIAKTTVLLTATLIFMLLFGALPIVLGVSFQVVRANVAIRMSETLVQLNSVINPIIYCYRDRRFRNAVLELLRIRKPLAIQPTDGSVRYRRRKSRFGSQENVQQELKTEGKFPRLARFASCDPTVGLNDEMMLKRTMSALSLVKFRKMCDDLRPQKPSSVVITTAVIHALKNAPRQWRVPQSPDASELTKLHQARKSNFEYPDESPGGGMNRRKGATQLIHEVTRSRPLDADTSDKFWNLQLLKRRNEWIFERPKSAPCSIGNAATISYEPSTVSGLTTRLQ